MRLDDDFAPANAAASAGAQRGAQDRRGGGGSARDVRGNNRRETEPAGAMAAAFAKLKR
jgi:uncharacterized protein